MHAKHLASPSYIRRMSVSTLHYDAWGNRTVTNASGTDIGDKNPIRYRGYYYDAETGLYYLNGRYYDPQLCRFISPDDTVVLTASLSSLAYKNLYAYCDNNPTVREDKSGQFWTLTVILARVVVPAVVGAVVGVNTGNMPLSGGITSGLTTLISDVLNVSHGKAEMTAGEIIISFIPSNPKVERPRFDIQRHDTLTIQYRPGQLKYANYHPDAGNRSGALSLADMAVDYRGRQWTKNPRFTGPHPFINRSSEVFENVEP